MLSRVVGARIKSAHDGELYIAKQSVMRALDARIHE